MKKVMIPLLVTALVLTLFHPVVSAEETDTEVYEEENREGNYDEAGYTEENRDMTESFAEEAEPPAPEEIPCAVYLGVKDYGTPSVNSATKENFEYIFFIDGEERTFLMDNGDPSHDSLWTYDIQNKLREGYLYRMTVQGSTVIAASPIEDGDDNVVCGIIGRVATKTLQIDSKVHKMASFCKAWRITWRAGKSTVEEDVPTPGRTVRAIVTSKGTVTSMFMTPVSMSVIYPVKNTPGLRTLKNFLATAFQPVGTTLYMFGGGWNWQDTGSGDLVTSIGVPQSWIDFFQAQTINYTFKSQDYASGDLPENQDPPHSYYPYYGFNEYNYAGVDCSAYIAWTVYNTINTESGEQGYLTNSRNMANSFALNGWGTITKEVKKPKKGESGDFLPGDVFSIDGHVWICIGTMTDGSLLILHSTPSLSYTSMPGGGPQLGAIGNSQKCDAYLIADRYMKTYFPAWSRRYPTTLKKYDVMTNVEGENTGKFSWDLTEEGILTDPDGYADMSPEEILADLFGEN